MSAEKEFKKYLTIDEFIEVLSGGLRTSLNDSFQSVVGSQDRTKVHHVVDLASQATAYLMAVGTFLDHLDGQNYKVEPESEQES